MVRIRPHAPPGADIILFRFILFDGFPESKRSRGQDCPRLQSLIMIPHKPPVERNSHGCFFCQQTRRMTENAVSPAARGGTLIFLPLCAENVKFTAYIPVGSR